MEGGMLAGLKGFEEVADRWEEGIGRIEDLRTSHTLDALGGRRICCCSNYCTRIAYLVSRLSVPPVDLGFLGCGSHLDRDFTPLWRPFGPPGVVTALPRVKAQAIMPLTLLL